ncbi:MAG: hypothetical protein WAL75_27570 [Terracidiphilus sp.]
MIELRTGTRIWIAAGVTDMRRGFDGLSAQVQSFFDVNQKCAINLVPFKQLAATPSVGDHVYLPGETEGEKNYGGGKYEVVGVDFHYREDSEAHPFVPATTSAIEIMVRKIASYS